MIAARTRPFLGEIIHSWCPHSPKRPFTDSRTIYICNSTIRHDLQATPTSQRRSPPKLASPIPSHLPTSHLSLFQPSPTLVSPASVKHCFTTTYQVSTATHEAERVLPPQVEFENEVQDVAGRKLKVYAWRAMTWVQREDPRSIPAGL